MYFEPICSKARCSYLMPWVLNFQAPPAENKVFEPLSTHCRSLLILLPDRLNNELMNPLSLLETERMLLFCLKQNAFTGAVNKAGVVENEASFACNSVCSHWGLLPQMGFFQQFSSASPACNDFFNDHFSHCLSAFQPWQVLLALTLLQMFKFAASTSSSGR